jgi:high frequency lysogenization protein
MAMSLAGIVQPVQLVVSAATSGMVIQDTFEKCLPSILVQNPSNISDIYHGTADIQVGLRLLHDILDGFNNEHAAILRYSFAVLALERNLAKHPTIKNTLGVELNRIEQLTQREELHTDQLVAQLADVYESTLGALSPRIRIEGNRNHLENRANVQKIRALLLSAVRSAVLWHQLGGRRWQLLLQRSSLSKSIRNLI